MTTVLIILGTLFVIYSIGQIFGNCGCNSKGEYCEITKRYRPSWEVANEKSKARSTRQSSNHS